ncbi:MAG TPA: beta-N-acetylhexosaminidase [Candidatus Sulfotelmatobacter sp.]|nr:beta-N-acetylhexosaminidase [Candidatus Sulfotelmatobacter sp.]
MGREPGQLLIVGFDGAEMDSRLASLLKRVQPAGVILFARNIKRPEQTWRLLRECQKNVEAPLFTCVDLEGGTVDRFRDVLGATPSVADVFATDDPKLFCKHGQIIGENCRALGFNTDFAPVLDLAFAASQRVMGSRSASADPEAVSAYAREFLAGLGSARVSGCGKHFPGLGEGKFDSHHELPVIEKSMTQLWHEDLVPYRRLRRSLPMVMVSHAAYPQVTKTNTPASLSRVWITDILKKRIGYRGLIVSDDLEMGGVLSAAPIADAAVEFVRAGGDVCLVCHREDYVLQAHEALEKATETDKKFSRRVAESSRRVLAFKKKWKKHLKPAMEPTTATVEKLMRRMWEFEEQVRLGPLSRREDRRRRG